MHIVGLQSIICLLTEMNGSESMLMIGKNCGSEQFCRFWNRTSAARTVASPFQRKKSFAECAGDLCGFASGLVPFETAFSGKLHKSRALCKRKCPTLVWRLQCCSVSTRHHVTGLQRHRDSLALAAWIHWLLLKLEWSGKWAKWTWHFMILEL